MARTGRPRGDKIYDDYLPQTAATAQMVQAARALADREYQGSIGALIRIALQKEFDREQAAQDFSIEPAILEQLKQIAADNQWDLSEIVRRGVELYIEDYRAGIAGAAELRKMNNRFKHPS